VLAARRLGCCDIKLIPKIQSGTAAHWTREVTGGVRHPALAPAKGQNCAKPCHRNRVPRSKGRGLVSQEPGESQPELLLSQPLMKVGILPN
jgi:hypothetical protein